MGREKKPTTKNLVRLSLLKGAFTLMSEGGGNLSGRVDNGTYIGREGSTQESIKNEELLTILRLLGQKVIFEYVLVIVFFRKNTEE